MTSIFFHVIGLFMQQEGSGSSNPPPPSGGGYVPLSPGLPIDDHIWILLLVGVFFGILVIYKKYRITNRAS